MKYSSPQKLTLQFALFVSILAFFVFSETLAQAGTLDPTFGVGGRATTQVPSADPLPVNVFVLSDGKILVTGSANTFPTGFPSPVLVRYNSNGSPDTSFGVGGVVYTVMADTIIHEAFLQPDGKIVLVGGNGVKGHNFPFSLPKAFTVMRYNNDGTLDNTFGNNGIATTSIGGAYDEAYAAALLPDGKILAVGRTYVAQFTAGTLDLARYNSNGTLDSTFGEGGIIYYFLGGLSVPRVFDMVLLANGKFLVTGNFAGVNGLARFNADGSFDTTFGTNGFVYSSLVFGGLTLQPDGKILLPKSVGFGVSRMNGDGSVDTSFGVNGTVETSFRASTVGIANSDCRSAILKSNGEIVAIGTAVTQTNSSRAFAVAHYTTNGALIGKTTISFPSFEEAYGVAVAIQPDDKIALTGFLEDFTNTLATARLTNITLDVRPYKRAYDFNGDFKDDFLVFRQGTGGSSGTWYNSSIFNSSPAFGLTGDIITPADYNDDGITDLAVFRPSNGTWYIANNYNNAANNFTTIPWGASGDIPAAGDYDADGKADVTVFRPSNGTWYILESKTNSVRSVHWGTTGDKPVVGDYDNDGKADVAVFRPSDGTWYILKSLDNQLLAVQFGQSGDIPVQADYNGDGRSEMVVFRPSNDTWYTSLDPATNYGAIQFGTNGDIPVPGDYTGDGKTDIAVWRPSNRVWYVRSSSTGAVSSYQWGASTDIPVPGN